MIEPPGSSRSPTRTAAAVSLVLHAGAILALWALPGRPQAAPDAERAPIEVVLQGPEPRRPAFFTELPEDRTDTPPEDPDFLSNVDSRARDDVAGGDEDLPRSDGVADAPQVEIVDSRPAKDAAPPATEPAAQLDPAPPIPAGEAGKPPQAMPVALPPPLEEELSVRELAGLDIRQQGMRNPAGNAGLSGDISLSTTAWEYAPWLQAFRRAVMARWLPPVAYRMGLIDGWVQARVEIAQDGSLLGVEVLDQDVGNPSLTDAVVYALEAPAPYHKLPAGFPDPTLRLTIRFVYPTLKGR